MRFSENFLSELRARTDIEELVSRYTEVTHRGSKTPVALCPFHTEKTPSFVIYRDTQSYYCFGCGAGGDAVVFIKNIERLDYTEAVRFLCERAGMNMPLDPVDDEYNKLRRRCYEANREAARFFHAALFSEEGAGARAYLEKRRIKSETITRFGLGFAPDKWDSLLRNLKSKGFSENELISFDLARKTSRGGVIDAFRNRLMFPIIDLRGNVIAFGGRVLDDSKPKYLNTSDTVVFKKSQGLYALNFAKNSNSGKLILCEGYMDVIAMHQAGFTNAVAGLGTAFTSEQISLLLRYCTELTLCFDSDEAGVKATNRALKMLGSTPLKLRVMRLQGGKDPDEIIKTQGREKMDGIINSAVNDTEFAMLQVKEQYDISSDDGKLAYLNDAVNILSALGNAIEKDVYLSRLASELGVDKTAISQQLEKAEKKRGRQRQRQEFDEAMKVLLGDNRAASPNPQYKQFPRACKAEEIILASLLKHPDYLKKFKGRLDSDVFITELNKKLFSDISGRIERGASIELSVFGEDSENSEISYLAYLLAMGSSLADSPVQCEDCIKVLLSEKEKRDIPSIGSLTDSDYLELFRKKKKDMAAGGSKR